MRRNGRRYRHVLALCVLSAVVILKGLPLRKFVLFYACAGTGFVDWLEKRFTGEKSFEVCIGLWQSLIVLRWPCAADRTLKSSYHLPSICYYYDSDDDDGDNYNSDNDNSNGDFRCICWFHFDGVNNNNNKILKNKINRQPNLYLQSFNTINSSKTSNIMHLTKSWGQISKLLTVYQDRSTREHSQICPYLPQIVVGHIPAHIKFLSAP